jgi:endonuclease YncB( thermonuclease family)
MKRVPALLLLVSSAVAGQGFKAGSATFQALHSSLDVPRVVARSVIPGLPPVVAQDFSPGVPPVVAQDFSPASGRFTGRVVAVLDGDSLMVLRDGRQVEVRLYGVDAPEGGQAFGSVAKRFLSNLAFGKTVVVEVQDIDRYRRSVSRVTADGADVGLDMIRGGYAWHYTQYSTDTRYASAEREARSARRGLWQDNAPIAPWEYRRPRSPNASSPSPSPRPSPLLTPPPGPRTPVSTSGPFHGNLSSHVFHGPNCEYYNCKHCTAVFKTYEAAMAAGYRPHNDCVKR